MQGSIYNHLFIYYTTCACTAYSEIILCITWESLPWTIGGMCSEVSLHSRLDIALHACWRRFRNLLVVVCKASPVFCTKKIAWNSIGDTQKLNHFFFAWLSRPPLHDFNYVLTTSKWNWIHKQIFINRKEATLNLFSHLHQSLHLVWRVVNIDGR